MEKTYLGGIQSGRKRIESSDQGSNEEQPSPEYQASNIRYQFQQHLTSRFFCAKLISVEGNCGNLGIPGNA